MKDFCAALRCTGHAAPKPLHCIHGFVSGEHVTDVEVLLLTLSPDSCGGGSSITGVIKPLQLKVSIRLRAAGVH